MAILSFITLTSNKTYHLDSPSSWKSATENVTLPHPAVVRVMGEPSHSGLQHVLLVAHVELLHAQQLAQPAVGKLPELLGKRHVAEMRLQEVRGDIVDVLQAVMQREEADADAVLRHDAALQELAAEQLQVGHEQQVGRLHHVLDGLLAQADLGIRNKSNSCTGVS